MRRTLTALVVITACLVGCGGGGGKTAVTSTTSATSVDATSATSTSTTTTSNQTQLVHACPPHDLAMQCVLARQPSPNRSLGSAVVRSAAAHTLFGIDFAWSKFPPNLAGSFGASYLSTDSSKNWSPGLIRQYHTAHRGTVAVFEEGGSQAAGGCGQGTADARFSERLLNSWGYKHAHFDMAIDFDASGSQVANYFICANRAEPGLVGAYGGYHPLQYLCAHHITTLNWQTYAWSGGAWLPASCAPLEQYLNGSAFDHDRAIAANYGQFPSPKSGPSQKQIRNWRRARNSSFNAYRHRVYKIHKVAHRGCTHGLVHDTIHRQDNCYLYARRVVNYQNDLWRVYKKWHSFGKHGRTKTAYGWIVRPSVAIWSHARTATRLAYLRNGCGGPATFPHAVHSRLCNRLRQREGYYKRMIHKYLY